VRANTKNDLAAGKIDGQRKAKPVLLRPLRILFLNYEYPPMGGGAGNATRCTATELARRGHVVHVLTSRLPAEPAAETVEGVTVCRVLSWRRSLHECGLLGALTYIVFAFIQLVRLARTYDYDVYHFYFGLPTGLLAPYVRFVLKKPYVLALRGSDVPGYDETDWFMRPLHGLLRPLSRFIWRNAQTVTVLSQNLRALALKTAPELETLVIPNGVNCDQFPVKPDRVGGAPMRLISVCRMVSRKGLEYLIEAMGELKKDGTVLELIGSGQNQRQIASLIRSRGLEDCIALPGYLEPDHLFKHYNRADVFVLPSLTESFGQVLLEALSCGLPVVASSVGGIPETIRHGRNGLLVPPRDANAIVEAVRWLAANPGHRTGMGRRNAEEARRRHGWGAVATRYEALYYRAVADRSLRSVALDGEYG
jgi:glycosyltransferase involved in cell wall biosynthesis